MLTADSVPSYIDSRPALSALVDTATLEVREVGDGNLNLVFICKDPAGRGLVLKQALPYVRLVGPEWPMTEQRAAREAEALGVHGALSDDVCRLLDFDPEQFVMALEDLSDHEVLRSRLNRGGTFEGTAQRVGRYVADVAFGTSFLALGEEEFRVRAGAVVNPELCSITEDLFFTEPYLGAERNSVRGGLAATVAEYQSDAGWIGGAMAMKRRFLTVQEMFIHGDLHTGSIFVRYDDAGLSLKAFDSEFACYGPIGFDIGSYWANMLAASARASALGNESRAARLRGTVKDNWHAFTQRMWQMWPQRRDPSKYPDSFLESWLDSIRVDAFGFAGCEAARRIIGLAKVSDVEELPDAEYVAAASEMLRWSKTLLTGRATLSFSDIEQRAVIEQQSDGGTS